MISMMMRMMIRMMTMLMKGGINDSGNGVEYVNEGCALQNRFPSASPSNVAMIA